MSTSKQQRQVEKQYIMGFEVDKYEMRTIEEAKQQAFSVNSFLFQQAQPKGAEAVLGYTTLNYLKAFFGPDFVMPHGITMEETKALIETAKAKGVSVYNDEDQYILAWTMPNSKGIEMQMKLQIFTSSESITSAAFVEILSRSGLRDVDAELARTVAYYEQLGKGDASNVKASMVTPNFIGDQKKNFKAQNVRRNSSVQLSTDYAQAAFKLLSSLGRSFSASSMNILSEMVAVKNKLGMTDEDCKYFSDAADGLEAKAQGAISIINDFRKTIERRAIIALGYREYPKSVKGSLNEAERGSLQNDNVAYSYGLELWINKLTEGDRKSLTRQVQTDKERDEIAMMNEDYTVGIAQELRKACDKLGENGMMKMAVAQYIRKYADPKPEESGFKRFWNIFEDGLVQALHLYENMDKDVVIYNAPEANTPAFFTSDSVKAREAAIDEIKTIKVGDVLKVIPQNGVMVLKLQSGDFKVSGLKTQNAFPVIPEGMWFEAPVVRINHKQKVTEGVSITVGHVELKGGAPTPPEQDEQDVTVEFEFTLEAIEALDEILKEFGSLHPFVVQEFFVWKGILHIKSEGILQPLTELNEITIAASVEPVAVEIVEIEGMKVVCR